LRKNQSNVRTINTNNRAETIYVGSKANKGNSLLLRIYDKKLEQEQKKGIYYDEALKCDDWVRFEMSIRQSYANQTGLDILKCRNDKELSSLIFQRFTDKYLFFKNDELKNKEFYDTLNHFLELGEYQGSQKDEKAQLFRFTTNNSYSFFAIFC